MAGGDLAIAHGGGLIAARVQFPDAPEPWIDLSTGINQMSYPVPSLSPVVFHRLPEPEDVRRLEAAAGRAYGVADPTMVVGLRLPGRAWFGMWRGLTVYWAGRGCRLLAGRCCFGWLQLLAAVVLAALTPTLSRGEREKLFISSLGVQVFWCAGSRRNRVDCGSAFHLSGWDRIEAVLARPDR
jgi:hypothetical protein